MKQRSEQDVVSNGKAALTLDVRFENPRINYGCRCYRGLCQQL